MSGHSKWATIKRKKGKADQQRGKIFSKYAREITVAAKFGGADPMGNPRLRLAIEKARSENMPMDNINRAIQKGVGGGEGTIVEEITYEGYGPGGVAMLVEVMTDNRNRTVGEIRNVFSKHCGNMGEAGCVGWMFKKKGNLTFEKEKIDGDALTMDAIDAGAEDINDEGSTIDVVTTPENFEKVRETLKKKGYEPVNAEVTMVPSSTIKLTGETAQKMLRLMELLEEHDDVQAVHANFDIPDEIINAVTA